MCGICLIKIKRSEKYLDITTEVVKVLENRGKDSWGYCLVNSLNSEIKVRTFMGSIGYRSYKSRIRKILTKAQPNTSLLIHSRLATSGFSGLSQHNQPIRFGEVVIAHNGLITNILDEEQNVNGYNYTDSMLLCRELNSSEPDQESIEKMFSKFRGEISVVWYDNRDLNFRSYTNNGGLYKLETVDFSIISSEPVAMLERKYETKFSKIHVGKVQQL